jgi:uncharacterized coiled-coil protein SlyX
MDPIAARFPPTVYQVIQTNEISEIKCALAKQAQTLKEVSKKFAQVERMVREASQKIYNLEQQQKFNFNYLLKEVSELKYNQQRQLEELRKK